MSSGIREKSLTRLAKDILAKAEAIDEYFENSEAPYPSLEQENGADLSLTGAPPDVMAARVSLINQCTEIRELLTDPIDSITLLTLPESYALNVLFTLCQFEVPQNVPLEGSISYSDLSRKTNLNESTLQRSIRLIITRYFFTEPQPGLVAHTTRSRLLVTSEAMRACIYLRKNIFTPISFKFCDIIEKYPQTSELPETSSQLAFGKRFFDYLGHNPEIETKFGIFMQAMSSSKNSYLDSGEVIAQAYPFGNYGGKTFVDVGGGIGHISVAIAKAHPGVQFIVEDKPDLAPEANKLITANELTSRVEFLPHNFFEPQPAKTRGASIYFLRNVIHNWGRSFASRILKNLVEAMNVDSKILICDPILPEPGQVPKATEMIARTFDMMMWIMHGGRDRSLEEFEELFKSVDERLKVTQVIGPPKMRRQRLLEVMLVG